MKGLNRLYFLYEGYDNYWDFAAPGLHNDIFEVVVDGDLSGGPLIDPSGHVVGVAFAIAPDQSAVAYAITIDQVQSILAGTHTNPVDVGPCTNG